MEIKIEGIKKDIKYIREGISRIDNHLDKLNNKVAENRLSIQKNRDWIENYENLKKTDIKKLAIIISIINLTVVIILSIINYILR